MDKIESIAELEAWQPPYRGGAIISDGILEPGTAMLIFGPPKSWKSIATLYTAFSIATGNKWFNFATTPSVVLVLQAELPKAVFRKRMLKFKNSYHTLPDNLFFITNQYCKLDTTYGKDVLNSYIIQAKVRYPNWHITIILDPVYLLMSGKATEGNEVSRMLDNLNELRTKHDLSIILIHHSHKTRVTTDGAIIDTGADEIYGSGYFNFWCDTQLKLKRLNPFTLDNKIEYCFTLTRNAERVLPAFEVEWSRATLQPTVTATMDATIQEEDITSRGLSKD